MLLTTSSCYRQEQTGNAHLTLIAAGLQRVLTRHLLPPLRPQTPSASRPVLQLHRPSQSFLTWEWFGAKWNWKGEYKFKFSGGVCVGVCTPAHHLRPNPQYAIDIYLLKGNSWAKVLRNERRNTKHCSHQGKKVISITFNTSSFSAILKK